VRHGPTRTFTLMTRLRTDYIVPAFRSADDKAALAAIAARLAFIRHLQSTSLPLCREFAIQGLQDTSKLDAEGKRRFDAMLAALEDAYRSGRSLPSKPALDEAAVRAAQVEAGFLPGDFANLERLSELADVEACALAARMNAAPTQVAAERAAPLARHLLAVQ
ncbi:MAG TPA: hypothetical protein VEC14_05675, partial [Reyranellaceae bacterium]|nr:hypothetical protein [Reyranellaceae bacterium]